MAISRRIRDWLLLWVVLPLIVLTLTFGAVFGVGDFIADDRATEVDQ